MARMTRVYWGLWTASLCRAMLVSRERGLALEELPVCWGTELGGRAGPGGP